MAPGHYLADRSDLSFPELIGVRLIMKEPGSATRKPVNCHLKSGGLKPEILVESSNIEFIKELVKQGEGISFLARGIVANEITDGVVKAIPFRPAGLFLNVGIAYLKNQRPSPAARAFLDFLLPTVQIQRPDFRLIQNKGFSP